MSYTPLNILTDFIENFQASYPKHISMFWLMRKIFPVETRPVNGTNYYDETAKEITRILREACPKLRGGIKKFTITRENIETLRRTKQISEEPLVGHE